MEQTYIHNLNENKTLGEMLEVNGVSIDKFKNYWQISNELINGGLFGKIFDIGNDKVLKISSDKKEYDAIHLLLDEINKNYDWFKHFVNLPLVICPVNENFYDSSFNNEKKYVRYYFIFKKLYKLSTIEEECLFSILHMFDVSRIDEIEIDYEDEIEDYYNKAIKETKKFESEINVDEIIRFVFNAYELSMEHSFYDMHIDNIMKDSNGNYKLIDLRL